MKNRLVEREEWEEENQNKRNMPIVMFSTYNPPPPFPITRSQQCSAFPHPHPPQSWHIKVSIATQKFATSITYYGL